MSEISLNLYFTNNKIICSQQDLGARLFNRVVYYLVGFICLLGVLKQSQVIGLLLALPLYTLLAVGLLEVVKKGKIALSPVLTIYLSIFIAVFASRDDYFEYNFETLFYVIPFYCVASTFLPILKGFLSPFLKGVMAGIKVNILFSIFVSVAWYAFNYDLATELLENALKIDSDGHTFFNAYEFMGLTILRVCGLSWDPMHIGLAGVLGYILFKATSQKSWTALSLITLLLSGSRAGMFSLIVVMFYELKISQINFRKKITVIFLILLLFGLFCGISISRDMDSLGNIRRLAYFIMGPLSMLDGSWHEIIIGGAPYSTGNILIDRVYTNQSSDIMLSSILDMQPDKFWNVESDIVSILIGRGLLGLFIWLFVIYMGYKSRPGTYRLLFLAFFTLSLNYSYEFSMVFQILLLYVTPKILLKLR